MINSLGFLLVNPQLPENIGFCARAIKNFGFKRLDVINPKEKWPNKKALATSVGAKDILKKTKIFPSIKDATKNYDIKTVKNYTWGANFGAVKPWKAPAK